MDTPGSGVRERGRGALTRSWLGLVSGSRSSKSNRSDGRIIARVRLRAVKRRIARAGKRLRLSAAGPLSEEGLCRPRRSE